LDLDEDSGGFRRERIGVEQIRFEDVGGWSQFRNKITFIPQLKGHVLTPKFGKESDLWVQLDEESVWQMHSAKGSAVGYLLPFGKGTVKLILRD
jgi:hypothetical protein